MTTLAAKISIPDQVTYSEVANEMVLLNLDTGKYFGLDEVGARMYALLAEHKSLRQAYQTLLDEYEVDPDRLEQDLIVLVDDLVERGLVTIQEYRE
jgi:hypothetical protein